MPRNAMPQSPRPRAASRRCARPLALPRACGGERGDRCGRREGVEPRLLIGFVQRPTTRQYIVRVRRDCASVVGPPRTCPLYLGKRPRLVAGARSCLRGGHLSKPELKQVLVFEVLDEIDGFLRRHSVFELNTSNALSTSLVLEGL